MHRILYVAFALSGAAGLIYEAVWGRYLALFVGHSAYAQVLVIGTYLGGMAIGAILVGQRSRAIRAPLLWYAGAELVLALAGILFHPMFKGVTGLAYGWLIPLLVGPGLVGLGKWGLAIGILMPQAILLGTTFPLMSSGFLRVFGSSPGRTLSLLYFTNSIGAAVGVLVGGFYLVARFGLPGSLASAAALNLIAAAAAFFVHQRVHRNRSAEAWEREGSIKAPGRGEGHGPEGDPFRSMSRDGKAGAGRGLLPLLLSVSFLTAVASFAYEIGWIRMLSLVMGSATHSFEVMLSAFILGLALGALFIRRRADDGEAVLSHLGWIQWLMGLAALGSLPLYASTFEIMAYLVDTLPATDAGYALFGVARYAIAVGVMLPSTIMAGMTLPLITAALLQAGEGERSIGWTYGINTLGSVLGVALAGLVALPLLGLKGLILAGALLDMGLGIGILTVQGRIGGLPKMKRRTVLAISGALVAAMAVHLGVDLDRRLLTSGVFRYGAIPDEGEPVLFYQDGRTATVAAHLGNPQDLLVLTTNGKPDASISLRWIRAQGALLEPRPIMYDDEATQTLLALIPLAHRPDAESAALIGHGSGLTGHAILAAPSLERAVTIEIEPEMIEASQALYPANARVFDDPRATFVIDDAKSYFASRQQAFDLIISEPSNPWVSGTSSLFTVEFYERIGEYLAPGGLFAQWFHCYEMNDELVATVLASLHEAFPHFSGFQVGPADILVLASRDQPLQSPDWSVFQLPDVARMLAHVPPLTHRYLQSLKLFDQETLAPFLEDWSPLNSDYAPYLDLGAERARFKNEIADGFLELGSSRVLVPQFLKGIRIGFDENWVEPVLGVGPFQNLSVGSWIPWALARGLSGEDAPSSLHAAALEAYETFFFLLDQGETPADWQDFMTDAATVEGYIHKGTSGIADSLFYGHLFRFLGDHDAPPEALAAADFLYGVAAWEHERAAEAIPALLDAWLSGEDWVPERILLDGGVLSLLAQGLSERASGLFDAMVPPEEDGGGPDVALEIIRGLVEKGDLPPGAGG